MVRRRLPVLFGVAILAAGCGHDPVTPPPGAVAVPSDSALVAAFAQAYRERDAATISALFADRDGAGFVFVGRDAGRSQDWGAERARRIHRRMFDPAHVPAGEPPVEPGLWVDGIELGLRLVSDFHERTDLYRDAHTNPMGLDPRRWRATEGRYAVSMQVHDRGYNFHPTGGWVRLVVVEDLARRSGVPGKFLLYRWEDETYGSASLAGDVPTSEFHSWTHILAAYAGDFGVDGGAAVVEALASAYLARDPQAFASLLPHEGSPAFRFELVAPALDGSTSWNGETERLAHERMFHPDGPWSPRVPARLWLRQVDIELKPRTGFVQPTDGRDTPDPRRWRRLVAEYESHLRVVTRDTTQIEVRGVCDFTVLEDLRLPLGAPGKFFLYRWREVQAIGATFGVEASHEWLSWSELKQLYLPPPAVDSQATLVRFLARAYRDRDLIELLALLGGEPGAEYRFVRDAPDPETGETGWDFGEELRIHGRMFRPDVADPPLPAELRLTRADVQFTAQTAFVERTDLYRSTTNPDGLDPARWRVTAAVYGSDGPIETAGTRIFQLLGRVRFVVLEDLQNGAGTPRRFLLYRWEDLEDAAHTAAAEPISWTGLRLLYR